MMDHIDRQAARIEELEEQLRWRKWPDEKPEKERSYLVKLACTSTSKAIIQRYEVLGYLNYETWLNEPNGFVVIEWKPTN